MNVTETSLPGVLLLEPRVFPDDRGFFFESYNQKDFREAGITDEFVQDNHSRSKKNVVRGLHYQEPNGQGKLVRCARGVIFDVAVDVRTGKWVGVELNDEDNRMLWIPRGYAHGFLALTDVDLVYKCTDYYSPKSERTIVWNDPDIGIAWPIDERDAIVSAKDLAGVRLRDAVMPTLV